MISRPDGSSCPTSATLFGTKIGTRDRSPRFARPKRSGYDSDKPLTIGERSFGCGEERAQVSFTTLRRMRLRHRPGRSE